IDAGGDFAVLNAPAGAASLEVGYWDRKQERWQSRPYISGGGKSPDGMHELSGRVDRNGDLVVAIEPAAKGDQASSRTNCAEVRVQADSSVCLYGFHHEWLG